MNRAHTLRIAPPLSLRKSAIVLWSGTSRPVQAPLDQAHQQRHRSLGPNYSRRSSLPDTLETACSVCDPCPQRSASSNPPAAKNQRCENHMKRDVFTQPGSKAAEMIVTMRQPVRIAPKVDIVKRSRSA